MPNNIWKTERIVELARAIYVYTNEGFLLAHLSRIQE